jgi:hypothetical protein
MSCSVTDEYTRKGLDVVFLENDTLRVEVLAGKGADITESGTSGSTRTCCTRVHTNHLHPR